MKIKFLKIYLMLFTALMSLSFSTNVHCKEYAVKLTINGEICEATFYDSETTRELKKLLPLKMMMQELNGNEKHGQISKSLPVDSFCPETIHKGDLLLWRNSTLVMFYKTFKSRYQYTKIGKLKEPSCIDKFKDKTTIIIEILP